MYTANLQSVDGRKFEGQFVGRKGGEESTGRVNGRLFWDETELVIVGSWHEDGHGRWFARLEEVDKFSDER